MRNTHKLTVEINSTLWENLRYLSYTKDISISKIVNSYLKDALEKEIKLLYFSVMHP